MAASNGDDANGLGALRISVLLKLSQMTEATHKEVADFALDQGIALTGSEIGYLAFMNEDESVLSMYSWSKTAMECAAFWTSRSTTRLRTPGSGRGRPPAQAGHHQRLRRTEPAQEGPPGGTRSHQAAHEHSGVRRRSHRRRGRRREPGGRVRRPRSAGSHARHELHVGPHQEHAGQGTPRPQREAPERPVRHQPDDRGDTERGCRLRAGCMRRDDRQRDRLSGFHERGRVGALHVLVVEVGHGDVRRSGQAD